MVRKKKLYCRIILIISAIIVLSLIIVAVSIVSYGKKDEKKISDVAIILGAGTSNGDVSPVYRERLNHGVWLYEQGYVKYMIVTGGIGKDNEKSDAFTAKSYLISAGIPEQNVFIEEKSTITEENLKYAKEIMDQESFDTAIIVSDPLHMKRPMLMTRDYGIDGVSSPTATTMYKSLRTKIPFLLREEFFYIGYCFFRGFRF